MISLLLMEFGIAMNVFDDMSGKGKGKREQTEDSRGKGCKSPSLNLQIENKVSDSALTDRNIETHPRGIRKTVQASP